MSKSFQVTDLSPLLQQEAHCVYCHTDIMLNDHVIVCDACRSPHHVDCWQANLSRCATFGCGREVGTSVASTPTSTERTTRGRSGRERNGSPQTDSDLPHQGMLLMLIPFVFVIFSLYFSSGPPTTEHIFVPTSVPYSRPLPTYTPSEALVTGIIQVRHADGEVRPVANTVVGLGQLILAVPSAEMPILYRDETSERGLFAIYGVQPGTYNLILDLDGRQLTLRQPDGLPGELLVKITSAHSTRVGVLEYDALSFPELASELQAQPTVPAACEPPALSIMIGQRETGSALNGESTKNQVSITISNRGDTVLEEIAVSHNPQPDCDGTIPSIPTGESYQYNCELTSASVETFLEVRAVVDGNLCPAIEGLRINSD